ncbi:GIY-YIG nuclease family protein [Paenibacillus aestuarii]|uniref:GIY-YIG nuclease family protein n=1 Tax=Paenibacillus aestuarii TaxID=516965 RepID=A0ABW0KC29_9BACL|nr:GIY-YIG nuclease family protein [Paenibacillus aestuarii]
MPFIFNALDYPEAPGCYMMYNEAGDLLYVGKSIQLRNRLRSYFQQTHTRKRTRNLVREIARIEVVIVNNETESLLLENNLIKLHKPPYNRALKKEKSGYAYLQLTKERVPRLEVHYRSQRHNHEAEASAADTHAASQRLGPFRSKYFLEALLEFITDHYGLRSCETMPKQVCLLYHIHKCSGVCAGMVSEEVYADKAQQAAAMLANEGQALIEAMTARMEVYAARLEFEKAQNMLQHIRNLEQVPDKQIVDREDGNNQDVLYFGEHGVMVARVKEGMLRDFRFVELASGTEGFASDRFLLSFYALEQRPEEIILNKIGDLARVRSALRRGGAGAPKITLPRRGIKFELLQLCKNNYEYRTRWVSAGANANGE